MPNFLPKGIKIAGFVSVVQWIERVPPKNQIWVRFPAGTFFENQKIKKIEG